MKNNRQIPREEGTRNEERAIFGGMLIGVAVGAAIFSSLVLLSTPINPWIIAIPAFGSMWLSIFILSKPYRLWKLQEGRRYDGLCIYCGYDCRATPGKCPECGGTWSITTPI